jgi:hypothetical protein
MLRKDIEDLFTYMNGHDERLSLDIANAQKRGDKDKEEFYKGAKGATDMFLRLLKEILEKNNHAT